MRKSSVFLAAAILAGVAVPAHGQASAGPLLARPAFVSWSPASSAALGAMTPVNVPAARAASKARNALIGGAIGAVAGLGFCTVISNITNEGGGFSTCTRKGYLLTGGVGFALGAAVGLIL